jgi:ATP-dependent Lon protease
VKEKFIAGKRSGLKTMIFPKDNQRDYDELPKHIKAGMKVYFASDYSEVFDVAFPKK